MKKNILSIIVTALMIISCNNQEKKTDLQIESEKWQKELLLNREVGKPCREGYEFQKWREENPEVYYGLEQVQSVETDFNSDGIKDGLFYFSSENCYGGTGMVSNYAMLVYSNNKQLLTNKNITSTIEKKIKIVIYESGIYDQLTVVLWYTDFDKNIFGNYFVRKSGDATGNPSFRGKFEFNPIDFSIKLENNKE
ncbi:hypothetical protein K8354_07945 [Polaribacter litorisediminis]|uniref:hypothetical protein n=1 Tax=Polaribacter litorisediminis TaxID=1908341 RepID=UPI001CC0DBFC|nr:hypothetical protein [Polaribacter litorisediminis]UAM99726.1 hypothetical protein K8354_07945 [Polaribacter litorisediminis]